ncbi:MAG TPA: HAMP domain-containing histidine kinase [Deltaproteobacteria bacterium]|nr:HAMP domain-containing histidine kinase [Deltaproteobacteria bacterium]HDZ89386.1 HAMP domain-containing histidine kinase [Deltaproteobacteria bacterium]
MFFSKGIRRIKRIGDEGANMRGPMKAPSPQGSPGSVDDLRKRWGEGPAIRGRIKMDLLIHDLKVPLAVIEAGLMGIMNRQEKYGPITERQEKVFMRALRNTKVLKALVNDALELGKSREGVVNASRFKLSHLIEQALEELFDLTDSSAFEEIRRCTGLAQFRRVLESKGVFLSVDEDLWCGEIYQDHAKLKQILRNLLSNALKYRKSTVELNIERTEDSIIFSVKDDGEGIPSAFHKKIFECYFQMDPEDRSSCSVRGHGLGLAGVMVLVEDLGGQLELDSDEGAGTRFVVRLPLKDEIQG